jgi:hypothetical protein
MGKQRPIPERKVRAGQEVEERNKDVGVLDVSHLYFTTLAPQRDGLSCMSCLDFRALAPQKQNIQTPLVDP